jgi:transposase-like protein
LSDDDDHSPEFRQRVLDSLGGERSLEDTARSFDIPPDLLFSWVRDGVAEGRLHPSHASSDAKPRATPATPLRDLRPDTALLRRLAIWNLAQPLLIPVVAIALFVMLLAMRVDGSFHESWAYANASKPVWAVLALVIGVVVFPLLLRGREADADTPDARHPVITAIILSVLIGVAISILSSLLAPTVLHRIERQPVQIETKVFERERYHGGGRGRGGCDWYLDTGISPQYVNILLCVDERTYDKAHFGQRVKINGFQSWYGLEVRSYTILDK